jgi:hypothetical protein
VPTSFPSGAPVEQPSWRDIEAYDPQVLSAAAGRGITNALEGTRQLLGGARDYVGGFMQSVRERSPEELRGTAPARSKETFEAANRAVSQAAQDPLTTARKLASAFVDVGAEAAKSPASTTEFIADILTPIPGPSVRRGPPVSQVVKSKGGDFPKRIEAIEALKSWEPDVPGPTKERAVNNWLDTKLSKYIRNEMATPEDPIRKLAEQGILHVDPEMINYDPVQYGDPDLGPQVTELLAQSPAAQVWEGATDYLMGSRKAGELAKDDYIEPFLNENPWIAEVAKKDPERKVYLPSEELGRFLGFDHLRDELFNSIDAESGLPPQLRLTEEQLGRMSVPDAVRHVSKINKWREKQKAEANFALANNAATVPFKDYPDQKYGWYQLTAPTSRPSVVQSDSGGWSVVDIEGRPMSASFKSKESAERALAHLATNDPRFAEGATPAARAALEDALRYEGDTMGHCVGGYCEDVLSGRSQIYSLRDTKTGAPHVTIEVEPVPMTLAKAKNQIDATYPDLDENDRMRMLREAGWVDEQGIPYPDPKPRIIQIKGKGNRKPKDEYIPFVQDFVRSGRWESVEDLNNTGLIDLLRHRPRWEAEQLQREGGRFVTPQELEAFRYRLKGEQQ